jgi:hypothetical protein
LQAIRRFRLTLNDDVKKTWLWGDFESTPYERFECYVVRTLNALLQDLFNYWYDICGTSQLENPLNAYDLVPSFSTRRRIRNIITLF